MAKIIKMIDLLKKEGMDLGKVFTDKDMPPFKVKEGKLTEGSKLKVGDKVTFIKFPGIIKKVHSGTMKGMVDVKFRSGLTTLDAKSLVKEGKLTEKINRSKVNSAFTKAVAAIRKISRKLSDDDNYEFIQKLEKWLK